MRMPRNSLAEKTVKRLQLIAGAITAIGVILGAIVSISSYITAPMIAQLNNIEQSTTRNELLVLINNYPDDRRSIESVAEHYFIDLHGDSYVFSLYSDWAKEHDVNIDSIEKIHNFK